MLVCGIDAGATRTRCLLADLDGRRVGEASGGGANLHAAGEAEVARVLADVLAAARGDRHAAPAIVCVGMAGVDRPADAALVTAMLCPIGGSPRVLVVNDALIALTAGAGDAPGVVVVAGTGSMAYGRNARGEAARAGGWGHVLGDEGSGYWIGRQALRAVVRASDGRGPRTHLEALVLAHYGVRDSSALVDAVYDGRAQPQAVAALARLVAEAQAAGDRVASAIFERAAAELTAAAVSVVRRLDLGADDFPVILAGGVFGSAWLRDAVTAGLSQAAPLAHVGRLDREPVEGALHLALAEARGGARLPAYPAGR